MTESLRPTGGGIARRAIILIALAVVSGGLFVWLMPGQHPLSAASYVLHAEGAERAAESFLIDKGYAVDGLEAEAELLRDAELLHRLQETLGRRHALSVLQTDEPPHVPAYYWRVRFRPSEDYLLEDEDRSPYYTVRVTQDGRAYGIDQSLRPGDAQALRTGRRFGRIASSRRIDREALATVMLRDDRAATEETDGEGVDLGAMPDSLFRSALSFNPTDTLWRRSPALIPASYPGATMMRALAADTLGAVKLVLGPESAVAYARFHLDETPWGASPFQADSVWLLPEHDNRVAQVRFAGEDPIYGQHVQADVVVSAAASLQRLTVRFEPADEEASGAVLNTVASVTETVTIVILLIGVLIGFFKRFSGRLVDGKAALTDGLVVGLVLAVMLGLIRDLNINGLPESLWVTLLIRLVMMMIVGAAVALFVMPISGATDSLARETWPEKLRASSLLRLGAWRNRYVGAALLRGTAVALVLLGLTAIVFWVLPDVAIVINGSQFLDGVSFRAMPQKASWAGLLSYLILSFVLLGVGTFVYARVPHAVAVVGAIAVSMAFLQGASVDVQPVTVSWLLSLLWGGVIGLTFWRFEFVTAFVAYMLALMMWSLQEGWVVAGSPSALDMWLGIALMGGLVVLGLVATLSPTTGRYVVDYVPDYVQDMKQKERLKGELEIAREVQESFLPRRMPAVEGLDIAGMCLAALEIGGDYFDFIKLSPTRLGVVVGDVSGKGTQAAFYMTLTKGIMQTLGREDLSPADVMRRFNTVFCAIAPRGTFISMIYGVIDAEERTFTFVRAGHNPVILKRSPTQEADLIQPSGLAIGLVAGPTFDGSIEEKTLHLRLGDVLVFYTDGFSEAMNRDKDLYGDDRLARKVGDVGQRGANEILRAVTEDVHHFMEAAGRRDDMTMVVVKVRRGAGGRVKSSVGEHAIAPS